VPTFAPTRVSAEESARRVSKNRLEALRRAAQARPQEDLGDPDELRTEALRVHKAFATARARANNTR